MPNQEVDCDFQKNQRIEGDNCSVSEYCADASSLSESSRVNVFEGVESLGDAKQVLVSTIGDLLNAKRISTKVCCARGFIQSVSQRGLHRLKSSIIILLISLIINKFLTLLPPVDISIGIHVNPVYKLALLLIICFSIL